MSWDVRDDDWLAEPNAVMGSGAIDEFDASVMSVVPLFRFAFPARAPELPRSEASSGDRIQIELEPVVRPGVVPLQPHELPEQPAVAEPEPPAAEPETGVGFHIPTLSLGVQPEPQAEPEPEPEPATQEPEVAFVIPVLSRPEPSQSQAAAVYEDEDEEGRPEVVDHVDSAELEVVGEEDDGSAGFVIPTLSRPEPAVVESAPEPELALMIPTLTRAEPDAPLRTKPKDITDAEEADELEEVEEDAIDLDSADLVEEVDRGVDAGEIIRELKEIKEARPPSPPPSASGASERTQPKQQRKKAWYDDVFGEHYLFLAPPTWDETAQRDAQFMRQQLALPDGATVLDVGCGDGRHAIELAKLGLRVFGLDNSLSMLLAAAQNKEVANIEDDRVSFMHGDMRRLPRDREFDAIICVGTTFGYFEEDQNRQCLQEMYERLLPGGKLLLHVFNRDFIAPHLPSRSWWQGRRCMVIDEAEMNFFASRLRVHRTIIFDDGRQYEHFMFMRAYTVQDLGKAISGQGLRVVEVSGSRDTRGRFFGSASPDIWIVAEKK